MKIKSMISILVFSLVCSQFSQAQFLKKLQKRVEQKVENTIIDKAADKAADKASTSMDDIFDFNPFAGEVGKKGDPSMVANTYDFSWKYSLKMTNKQGELLFDYFLQPDATYFGFTTTATSSTGMFTIMDSQKELMIMFIQNDANNIGTVSAMPSDMDMEEDENAMKDFTFEQLPDKTINGYRCKGIKGKNPEYEMIMYLTNEVEVSFSDIYKKGKTNMPLDLKEYFEPEDKVLMISMDIKSLKKEKYDMKMECVGLEKEYKTIKKSDYKFM